MMRRLLIAFFFSAECAMAHAMDAGLEGYLDLRLVLPADERSWLDGGLGKTRYGGGDSNLQFAELAADGHVLLLPELIAFLSLRAGPDQRTPVDLLEAYMRYRPVSTTEWRWSVKAGAFFPPISLENTEMAWTSYWTLTPSAINTWVGAELRTIGAEATVEWRRERGTLTLSAAAFGWNDPAGVMIADRGWTLDDHPTGLFDRLREPDATAILFGAKIPLHTPIFKELDHRVGWYGRLSWDEAGTGAFEILYYDNLADPAKEVDGVFGWRTYFWSAGFKTHHGQFTLLLQGMTGRTIITPFPNFDAITNFDSAFALLGWEEGDVRLAARAEVFETREHNPGPDLPFSENGHALTFAASWFPREWLRLTAEALHIESTRDQRFVTGDRPKAADTQLQLSARLYF
ncbi:MAG: hypothetical protein ACT4OG_01610 [Alphaproteobacteria bacterium]